MLHATEGLRLATACRNVLVPLDGSREAEAALGIGQWLTRCLGAQLHLLTADVRAIERYWYEPYLKTVTGDAVPAVPHWTDDRDVVGAIRTTARNLEPSVVCMATRGRSRSAAIVGSTFAGLAVAGGDPLVAVGPRLSLVTGPDPRRTVACVNLAAPTEPAWLTARLIDQAAMWARAFGHSLTLLTTVGKPDLPAAERRVEMLATDPGIDDLQVEGVALAGSGSPHTAIARHLTEQPATFLATATQGRTGATRALFGSETARIIHHSPAPVLVVAPSGPRRWNVGDGS